MIRRTLNSTCWKPPLPPRLLLCRVLQTPLEILQHAVALAQLHLDELVGVAEFYRYKNRNRTQSAQYRELALQASRDALTGVANRGALENQLSRIMQGSVRTDAAGHRQHLGNELDEARDLVGRGLPARLEEVRNERARDGPVQGVPRAGAT